MRLPKIAPQHIIDEEAQLIFRSFFSKKTGYLVQKYPEDYGLDYSIELLDGAGQTSGIYFNVQLKGLNKIRTKKDISVSLKKTTINLFSRQLAPTILIVVDVSKGTGYWHNSYDFINELDKRHPSWRNDLGKTATIHVPVRQELSPTEQAKIREYVASVHTRRSAVPQGEFILMQPLKTAGATLSMNELSRIVLARDYDKFIDVISEDPFHYLSDLYAAALFDLFDQLPPRTLQNSPIAMAILAVASYRKGYYQEARKWCYLSLSGGLRDRELLSHIKIIQFEINFMFGYISEQAFSESIEEINSNASSYIQKQLLLRKIRLEFWRKEKEEREYGRFRQMNLLKSAIEQLWHFIESNPGAIQELAYLELGHFYLMLVPFLWMEIESTAFMRGKVGLQLSDIELQRMRDEAVKTTTDAHGVFEIFVKDTMDNNLSIRVKAEGLFNYAQYVYNLQINRHANLIFVKDLIGEIPDKMPLLEGEGQEIKKALSYCEDARKLFNEIGIKDREVVVLIFMLSFYEDLDLHDRYEEAKREIEESLKKNWVPNTANLFQLTLNRGSIRTRLIKDIAESKRSSDFDKAKMNEVEIEAQVECNSQTFNITEKNRIENLRKDIKSMILAAKFRMEFCKNFELLQDRRHSYLMETLYTIDPNRVGICQLFHHKSLIEHNDAEMVINSFKEAYCTNCNSQEPLNKK